MTETRENMDPKMVGESEDAKTQEFAEGLEQKIVENCEEESEEKTSDDVKIDDLMTEVYEPLPKKRKIEKPEDSTTQKHYEKLDAEMVEVVEEKNRGSNKDAMTVELIDLPLDLLSEILLKLDVNERCVLRQVCRRFCSAVDSYPEFINITHAGAVVRLEINGVYKDFYAGTPPSDKIPHKKHVGRQKKCMCTRYEVLKRAKRIREAMKAKYSKSVNGAMEAAFLELGPKIEKAKHIGEMSVLSYMKFGSEFFISKLAKLKEHLNVERVCIRVASSENVIAILAFFNAQALKEIRLVNTKRYRPPLVDAELYKSSQFKHLTCLDMVKFGSVKTEDLSKLYHLENLSVKVTAIDENSTFEIIEAFRGSSKARNWFFELEKSLEIDERVRNMIGDLIDENELLRRFRIQIADAKKKIFCIQDLHRFDISDHLIDCLVD